MIFQTKSVGIDIRPDFVRMAVVTLTSGRIKVQNLIEKEIPETPEHERKAVTASIIKGTLDENGLKGAACVACLPASLSINRVLTIPLTDAAKIRQTLKFQIEPQIPYPIDQVICDSMTVRNLGNTTEVLAVAVGKEVISDRLQVLALAGVSPEILTIDALALADFYMSPLHFSSDRVTALLLVGSESSFLGFFAGERLIGYRNLDGMPATEGDTVDKLTKNLHRSIVGFQPAAGEISEVGALCIAGQVTDSLQQTLQQSFREFSVRTAQYNEEGLVDIPADLLDAVDDCRLAIALAHCGLRVSGNPINLRREEFASPSLIHQIKPRIVFSAAMLAVMMLAWFGNVQVQIYNQSRQLDALNEEMLSIFADALPGIKSPSAAEAKIRDEQEKFKALKNYSSDYVSPLEVLAEVAGNVPPGKNLVLSEMHISENVARLRGTVDSFDDVDVFRKRIEDSPLLSSVKIESTAKAEKGKHVNFRIRAQFGRESTPSAGSRFGGSS